MALNAGTARHCRWATDRTACPGAPRPLSPAPPSSGHCSACFLLGPAHTPTAGQGWQPETHPHVDWNTRAVDTTCCFWNQNARSEGDPTKAQRPVRGQVMWHMTCV